MNIFLEKIGLGHAPANTSSSSSSIGSLPRYAPLDSESARFPSPGLTIDDNESQENIPLADNNHLMPHSHRRRRQQAASSAAAVVSRPAAKKKTRMIPSSHRFWADFTLGFADGLTVPFALTAGLSSLGHTDTVLYAGLAEISAGCISMGIGGYLSARQTSTPSLSPGSESSLLSETAAGGETASYCPASSVADAEKASAQQREDKAAAAAATIANRYLEPLRLPFELRQLVLAHLTNQPHVSTALAAAITLHPQSAGLLETEVEDEYCDFGGKDRDAPGGNSSEDDDDDHVWPVSAGLSVAVGYLIGGMLPLWPYFFVTSVGDGLRWSFAVCVLALFLFGFIRHFCLSSSDEATRQLSWQRPRIPWRRVCKSAGEGLQMVILGGIAALAAVLCVRMFEGSKTDRAPAAR